MSAYQSDVPGGLMERIVQPFVRNTDSAMEVRQKSFAVTLWLVGLVLSGAVALVWHVILTHDHSELLWVISDAMLVHSAVVCTYCLLHVYKWGLTSFVKIFFIVNAYCWLTMASIIGPFTGWELWYILILDWCLVMQEGKDRHMMHRLSILLRFGMVTYALLHVLSQWEVGLDIHPFDVEISPPTRFMCCTVPILLNFSMMKSYAVSAQIEAHHVNETVQVASRIAHKLANFDLDGADTLLQNRSELQQGRNASPVRAPLMTILRNLRSYRPFLPSALFVQGEAQSGPPPNRVIADAMHGEETSWEHVRTAVKRLREPEYCLKAFSKDVEAAFPELKLYHEGEQPVEKSMSRRSTGSFSSGLTGSEEHQRTMGAMYAVYCIARMDIDGKEIFSYGVDRQWLPQAAPQGEAAERRRTFYEAMQWDQMIELFVRADLLVKGADNKYRTNAYRMTAFLVLTAVHDVMKNTSLLPTVQKRHAPYSGIASGSTISDHDMALAYVMEHFPGLLPSFYGLEPGQRAPILFSQGKLGFNNGWLVQGEAPPGALFCTFKRCIVQGGASEADISFYFAHWITDLAGAEVFGHQPWPGADKFVLKFPLKVLTAFLDSFAFIDHLASKTEVEVMEEYLQSRWRALGPPAASPSEDCKLAAMRLALMAQGFEAEVVNALHQMPSEHRDIIASEMARTGLMQQFQSAPADVKSTPEGPAFLVYYAPALIQKAGAGQVLEALRILACVYQAARQLYPLAGGACAERTVIVRIDQLKVLTPNEIIEARAWHLKRTADSECEAAAGTLSVEEATSDVSKVPLML